MKQHYILLPSLRKLYFITLLLLFGISQFSFSQAETEPNNIPNDSGAISMNTSAQIFGVTSSTEAIDYWKFSRLPFATGTINMSIQSGIGNPQVGMTLEKRLGSYSGTIISEVVINNGENASNQAFSLDYSGDFYYLLKS